MIKFIWYSSTALCCQKTIDVCEPITCPNSKISFVAEPVAIGSTFDTIFNPVGYQCCQIWPSHGKSELTNFIQWDYKWCQICIWCQRLVHNRNFWNWGKNIQIRAIFMFKNRTFDAKMRKFAQEFWLVPMSTKCVDSILGGF